MKKIINPALVIIIAAVIFIACKKNPPEIQPQPISIAGNDSMIRLPLDSLRLDGSLSYDPNGMTLSYLWNVISGPPNCILRTPKNASTILTNLSIGDYAIELEVTTVKGVSAKDTIKIHVAGSPQVLAGSDWRVYLPTTKFSLKGSTNLSPNEIQKIEWYKITGPNCIIESPNTLLTEVSQLQEGNYQFGLAITINTGVVYKDTCKIYVEDPAKPYMYIAPWYNLTSLPNNFITLTGHYYFGSNNPTSNVTKIEWNKKSGPAAYNIEAPAATSTKISNLAEGLYVFECKMTFDNGYTVSAISTVAVTNPASPNHELILENRRWNELPEGFACGYLLINLNEHLPTGTPIKQVFIKTGCLTEWREIFLTDPAGPVYTYGVSDGQLVIEWCNEGCYMPNDTPDIKIVY